MGTTVILICKSCGKTNSFEGKSYDKQLDAGIVKCEHCGEVINRMRRIRTGFSKEPIGQFVDIDKANTEVKLNQPKGNAENNYGVDMSDVYG